MDNMAGILIGVAALFSVGVVFSVALRVFSGGLVPLAVRKLLDEQSAHIAELQRRNTILEEERSNDKPELVTLIKRSTEAIFSITTWLSRYESLGGFASSPGHRRATDPKEAPGEDPAP